MRKIKVYYRKETGTKEYWIDDAWIASCHGIKCDPALGEYDCHFMKYEFNNDYELDVIVFTSYTDYEDTMVPLYSSWWEESEEDVRQQLRSWEMLHPAPALYVKANKRKHK